MTKKVDNRITESEFNGVLSRLHFPKNPPQLIIVAGPCRVGSTALSNVFARRGLVSYMQPIKSIRREIEEGLGTTEWRVNNSEQIVLSKETFGARSESEFFDPVDILLRAGYPKDKIHLIGIIREPESTLTSWTWMWNEVLMEGFIRAYQDTLEMMTRSERLGIETTYYVHEAIRDNDPGLVVNSLFKRVLPEDLRSETGSVVKWENGPNFDQASEVKFFDSPPERFVHAVKTWGGYKFKDLVPELTKEQVRVLEKEGVNKVYDEFRSNCQRNLGIKINRKGINTYINVGLETKEEELT